MMCKPPSKNQKLTTFNVMGVIPVTNYDKICVWVLNVGQSIIIFSAFLAGLPS